MSENLTKKEVFFYLLCCAGMLATYIWWQDPVRRAKAVPFVESEKLISDFAQGELYGLSQNKGKIRTRATFATSGKAITPWIIVAPDSLLAKVSGIQCHISNSQLDQAANLTNGQLVTIEGEPVSLTLKMIHLKPCRII